MEKNLKKLAEKVYAFHEENFNSIFENAENYQEAFKIFDKEKLKITGVLETAEKAEFDYWYDLLLQSGSEWNQPKDTDTCMDIFFRFEDTKKPEFFKNDDIVIQENDDEITKKRKKM